MAMDYLEESYDQLCLHLNENKNEAMASSSSLLEVNEKIWRLKHMLKHLMSYHEFLYQIKKEPKCWMNQDMLEEKTRGIAHDYGDEKNKEKLKKGEIEKLELLLDETEKICQRKSDIDNEMAKISKKKENLELLRRQFDARYEVFNSKCNSYDEAKSIIEEQKSSIEAKLALIDLIENDMKQTRDDVYNNHKKLLIKLQNLLFMNADQREDFNSRELALSLCEELSGVRVQRKTSTSHEIKMEYGQDESKKSEVLIDTTYARQKPPYPTKLIDVKVSDCSVAVEDITSRVMSNHDCAALATELQCRFARSTNLSDEISELRKLSAIDWIPDENKLVVIVGTYICTLFVPDGYPNSQCVQLTDIKGVPEGRLTEMKPLQDEPSVSDWVNYLEMNLTDLEK